MTARKVRNREKSSRKVNNRKMSRREKSSRKVNNRKISRRKKGLLAALLGLLLLGFSAIRIATISYPVTRGPSSTAASNPLIIKGVLHIHTTRSDGKGDVEQVARAAKAAGLKFIVLADHNTPAGPAVYRQGVLVLPGVEISTRAGHLLAYDVDKAPKKGLSAAEALKWTRARGALAAPAHGADSKRPWTKWELPTGAMEIYNASSDFREELSFPLATLIASFFSFPFNHRYAFQLLHDRPAALLKQWDSLTARRKVIGLCGADAHGRFGYQKTFSLIRTHVQLDRPLTGSASKDRRIVFQAIRQGRLYCALDFLAPAEGVTFTAHSTASSSKSPGTAGQNLPAKRLGTMGDALLSVGGVRLVFDLGIRNPKPAPRIRLLRNGRLIAMKRGGQLIKDVKKSGAYRVEVDLPAPGFWGGGKLTPWLYTNPIYIGAAHDGASKTPMTERSKKP